MRNRADREYESMRDRGIQVKLPSKEDYQNIDF